MTVNELLSRTGFEPASLPDGERVIDGVYIGDLLSWVMGRARENNAWLTIMSNVNVVAVASLTDVSCVILCEDVTLEEDILKTASDKGINVILSPLTAYETAQKLNGIL
ncbi:MAG: hypothetical protein MJ091_03930 [Clostridia bacterium]|nr:hypothetical protein [Clostridia bacterium]